MDFGLSNVVFSFLMYGRVSGGLDHDNPYWQRRHPERVVREAALVLPGAGSSTTTHARLAEHRDDRS
ncbi:hypothetical protein GCM10010302_17060 [Streptomyces polychromogenes]|uniref:Uncharacterized protein n=1 Tax=Streptomyces polychromogenes TaxID=67342 RepID=A0ABP3EVM9_9ACTN